MEKYSTEYWLVHYEYAMGHKDKINIDVSNAEWTQNNIKRILNNEKPYGMTGTNGAKALIEYIDKYHPSKKEEVVYLMIKYIESVQTIEKPLNKVFYFYTSLLN